MSDMYLKEVIPEECMPRYLLISFAYITERILEGLLDWKRKYNGELMLDSGAYSIVVSKAHFNRDVEKSSMNTLNS